MSSKNFALRILGGLLLASVLVGCSSPTLAPLPTIDLQPTLNAVQTQAAGTVIAGLTQKAPTATPVTPATATATQAPPTATLAPSNTPLPLPTTTATLRPYTPTPTSTPIAWGCIITSFTPKQNTTYPLNSDFDATWVIKNTGTEKWFTSDIDILYSSGTKLQKLVNGLDLKANVASGESYTAAVDMHTPSTAGTYSTTWAVQRGDQVLCTMTLTIITK